MRYGNARTVRLRQEMFCNNGRNEAWFDNFKLQNIVVYGQKHKVWVLAFLVFSVLQQTASSTATLTSKEHC